MSDDGNGGVSGFGERLASVIGKESLSAFGRRAGVGEGSLRQYLKGSMPQIDKAAGIAEAGNVSLDWLILGEGETLGAPALEVKPEGDHEFRLVPRYDIRASAGAGQLVSVENIDAEMAFRSEWLRRAAPGAKNLALIEAEGDSMEPTLRNRDTLLINMEIRSVEANGIYLIQLGGLLLVKRLQPLMNGGLLVRSDNENYRDEEIAPDNLDAVHVVGRVIWYGRQL